MLQLIGWLGCAYLVVKVLGYMANPAFRKEDGSMKEEALAAVGLGWLAAIGFAIAFLVQGNSIADAPSFSSASDFGYDASSGAAAMTTEMPADEAMLNAEAAADEVAEAAERAADEAE